MNSDYYHNNIKTILQDDTKFRSTENSCCDAIKRKANKLIDQINKETKTKFCDKLTGTFKPGYIYGNPKIHKDKLNPKLRPIISTIPTPTYELSKKINEIINAYMPNKYSVSSTIEFISLITCCKPNNYMGSLDVESLFTNVPLYDTIDIILNYTYRHPSLPPPKISEESLKEALVLCTTMCPFSTYEGKTYIQIDGVSMGCVLGPTFANYYMGHLEEKVLNNNPNKPEIYCRYMDDIFISSDKDNSLQILKDSFEKQSVLKFTFEKSNNDEINFLDVHIKSNGNIFHTSVHIKDTNNGDYLNYKSICPQRYKVGVIKTLLHHAYLISSNWDVFDKEIFRLKQTLINNNFPQYLIEQTIKQFLRLKFEQGTSSNKENLNLYFCNQMTVHIKQRENQLKNIINKNITVKKPNEKV